MSFLALDVGTTGCKAMVLSAEAEILALAQREYDPLRPHPGWAELDSAAVWVRIQEGIREVAAKTLHDPIAAVCVASMGEVRLLYPFCQSLRTDGSEGPTRAE